jgi:hypothetical protein
LRIAVIVSAQLLLAAAVVITLTLPLDAAIRGGACLCCIALGRFELQRLRYGHSNCLEIRLTASGEALILNQEQEGCDCVVPMDDFTPSFFGVTLERVRIGAVYS